MIECTSIKGYKKMVPKEKLSFRPGAYAVIMDKGKIALITAKSNNKYYFPGGEIEINETIEIALKREVREETGLKIEVEKFIHFKEQFIYYDHRDKACHCFSFFYLCKPLFLNLASDDKIIDDDIKQPQWIELTVLDKTRCGGSVIEILQLFKRYIILFFIINI